jgi:hypothetical protein
MNGFIAVPLKEPGLLRRILHRKPKENALREIQNLLAERSITDLTAADVETVLSNYELPRPEVHHGLIAIYQAAVDYRAKDLRLPEDDKAELSRLRYVLGLDETEARQTELDILCALYRASLRAALRDRVLKDDDKKRLAGIVADFGLTDETQSAIYKEEVLAVIQAAFNEAVADQRLTDEEEQALARMSDNLGVKVTHDNGTQSRLERFRLLARIDNGQLPAIDPGVILQKGELCHVRFDSALHELRTVTKAIAYHGPSGRIRIMKGLSWRYGYVNVSRVTTEQLRQLDSGQLLVTNKRLLFNGAKKNVSLPLKRVIHFTLFNDAIQIEKDSGRDLFFKGAGDLELIGAILEACLRQSR